MGKYTWSKKLLMDYLLNPFTAADFEPAFDYLDSKGKSDVIPMSPIRVIGRDCNFFDLNPYIPEGFERIINEDSEIYGTRPAKKKLSIEEALRTTKAFYNSVGGEVKSAFNVHFNRRYTHLMATMPDKENGTSTFTGHCFTSQAASDCLIDFYASMDFDMLCILIHEYGHAVGFTLRDYVYTYESNHAFSEIESIFMELIAANWLRKNTSYGKDITNGITKVRNDILDTARYSLETYDICSMVMDMHLRGETINMDRIIAQAQKEFTDMDKDYMLELLENPIDMSIPYGYSGLIAIELYQIYLQDPKAAIDLYKRIVRLNEDTPTKMSYTLEKLGITPGKNFDEFSRSLKR